MNKKQFIEGLNLEGQRVLTRVDFNVPLNDELNITDNGRIKAALPTVNYIIENGGKAVLMSHLGRPGGERVESMSLKPAAVELSRLLGQPVTLAPDCIGEEVKNLVNGMQNGDVVLLENLRFHKAETKNDPSFCEALAENGDVYVNDAFGTAHRAHASAPGPAAWGPLGGRAGPRHRLGGPQRCDPAGVGHGKAGAAGRAVLALHHG